MKKIIIFLLTILCLIKYSNVEAQTSFYEAEKIDGIFTKSVNGTTSNYQKARVFRRTSDNKEAYCLEPFITFDENQSYDNYGYATNLDEATWERIALLAHYGYGYGNHTDMKWYAITQLMIWQTAEPDKEFYFTRYLNGPKVEIYQEEINEINNLIKNYQTIPNFNYNTTHVIGKKVILDDKEQVLNNYYIDKQEDYIRIENNKLIIENIKEGKTSIIIKRKLENENDPAIFYYNSESQNLMTKGYIGDKLLQVIVRGQPTKITITKIDFDTNSTTPKGDAKLNGAVYGLYNENDELLKKITIEKNCQATLENIDYGKYYLKEIIPGEGYTLNEEKYYFEINQKNTNIDLKLKNKVIEKEINIHKEFGDSITNSIEKDISFDIYNSKNELINTITTDHQGNAKITLPYGKYTIKQRNTTPGYKMIDDFIIEINDQKNDYYYKLYDYKIKVPDTRTKESSFPIYLIIIILTIKTGLYLKRNVT